jgi:RHS repeat-associated protein
MENLFTTPKYRAHHLEYAKNGRAVSYVWGETYDLSAGVKTNWEVHYGREFRYDGARERYLVRELDPEPLKTGGISSLKDTWTDYDGDEPYVEYTVTQGTPDVAVPVRSFELGIGTFDWGDDGLGNILPVASSAKMFHMDHLGTTQHMTDSTGVAGEASVYTAFGSLKSGTAHAYGYDGAWGYRSDLADTATSVGSGDPVTDPRLGFPFLHVGHRYYDPSTGRFLQRDPIGIAGGINVYSYAYGIPTGFVDSDGLSANNPGGAAGNTPAGARAVVEIIQDMPLTGAKGLRKWQKHWNDYKRFKKAMDEWKKAIEQLSRKAREQARKAYNKQLENLKGHEKELRQKWPDLMEILCGK